MPRSLAFIYISNPPVLLSPMLRSWYSRSRQPAGNSFSTLFVGRLDHKTNERGLSKGGYTPVIVVVVALLLMMLAVSVMLTTSALLAAGAFMRPDHHPGTSRCIPDIYRHPSSHVMSPSSLSRLTAGGLVLESPQCDTMTQHPNSNTLQSLRNSGPSCDAAS